jgi:hypothetical protein
MGPIQGFAMAFVADVETQDGLVAVQGAADGSAKLPTGDNPDGIIGVFQEARAIGQHVGVQMDQIKYVAVGAGGATRGHLAAVLSGGKVQNVATSGTPVQQPYLGQFMESAVYGDLVLVLIRPGYITS